MGRPIRYRLGLDLGANSLGWCIVQLNDANEPIGLVRMGVRLFRDGRNPKDKASLAVARRMARGMRRRRDRWLKRQHRFMQALIAHGLMPADDAARKALESLDPYSLRSRALDEALTPHQVGRALFHINQRRGFSSNRKLNSSVTDAKKKKEQGAINTALVATHKLREDQEARTIGQLLAARHEKREAVRARRSSSDEKAPYVIYMDRGMISHEFDEIWKEQSKHQPSLFTEAARKELHKELTHQRDLLPVSVGRCTFEPEPRAPKALPSAQRFRILQDLNHLRIEDQLGQWQPLHLDQRNLLADLLETRASPLPFDKIGEKLKLGKTVRVNLQSEARKDIKGNSTCSALSAKDCFGKSWQTFSLSEQDEIVERLIGDEPECVLIEWLTKHYELSTEHAENVVAAHLGVGHLNLSKTAIGKLLFELQRAVVPYSRAVEMAYGTSHSDLAVGAARDRLPYYGEILHRHVIMPIRPKTDGSIDADAERHGKIGNPTVHIGLNQLRRVVNKIIERYGPPTEIVLEVVRDLKMSEEKRKKKLKEQNANKEANKLLRDELRARGMSDEGDNFLKLKLWHELKALNPMAVRCPYTGERIGQERLFLDVEIDHILPFSRTLDDSSANKTLCITRANRDKRDDTPYEAFHSSPGKYSWEDIQQRLAYLPEKKRWRFAPNAMQLYMDKYGGDFLKRHLSDTAYVSRVAREYLSYLLPEDRRQKDIRVTPGLLTSLLREHLGFEKSRLDQRHHALDAAMIAVTDMRLLKTISDLSRQGRLEGMKHRIVVPPPWDGFHQAVSGALDRIAVSYKPDHGHEAAMHDEAAVGFEKPIADDNLDDLIATQVVRRIPIEKLKPKNLGFSGKAQEDVGDEDDAEDDEITGRQVKSPSLRERLRAHVGSARGVDFTIKLKEFSKLTGTRSVRITEPLTVIPVRDDSPRHKHRAYKGYRANSNYCFEIYRQDGEWAAEITPTYLIQRIAEQPGWQERRQDKTKTIVKGLPLVMRLCKDDTIAIGESDPAKRTILRVVKFSKGSVTLAEIREGGDLKKRNSMPAHKDPFSYMDRAASALFKLKARRVIVTELGFVHDPGFKP